MFWGAANGSPPFYCHASVRKVLQISPWHMGKSPTEKGARICTRILDHQFLSDFSRPVHRILAPFYRL